MLYTHEEASSASIANDVSTIISFDFETGHDSFTHSVTQDVEMFVSEDLLIDARIEITIDLYDDETDTSIKLEARLTAPINQKVVKINYYEDFDAVETDGDPTLIDEVLRKIFDTLFGEIKFELR